MTDPFRLVLGVYRAENRLRSTIVRMFARVAARRVPAILAAWEHRDADPLPLRPVRPLSFFFREVDA